MKGAKADLEAKMDQMNDIIAVKVQEFEELQNVLLEEKA